ncbi:MAG TPA: acyltransferase [Puia sp.]|jgi:peptidoglycan/LPS O-acetylase OafA/YrhL|nr:acyltransferase [Puia sp.]
MAAKGGAVYFPNLNGLRAIGASIVMIGHVDFIKLVWGVSTVQWFPVFGKIGVALFFSLSGFLITSLLFNELDATHTIRLKDFYIRRILRIWPLYYWVVLLGLLVLNRIPALKIPGLSDGMYQNMTMLGLLNVLLIIPNFTHFYIPYSDQRWSIIVEEQFYLIQPAVVRIFRTRRRLVAVFCLLAFASEIVGGVIRITHLERHISAGVLGAVMEQLKYLGCIAVGCLASTLIYKRESKLKEVLFSQPLQWLVLVSIVALALLSFYRWRNEEAVDFRIYCVLFSIVVVNGALNPKNIYRLETPVLNFLGKISYGIYMYHMMCIGIAFAIVRALTANVVVQNVLLYILSIGLTILVSWLSFDYFESFFLRLKPKLQALTTRKRAEKAAL